jgi:hypothetical protein
MTVKNIENSSVSEIAEGAGKIESAAANGWRFKAHALSLPEVNASIAVNASAHFWRKLFVFGIAQRSRYCS